MFSDFERVAKMVTDRDLDRDTVNALQKKGVEVFMV
jgi:hypothetical protein